MMELIKGLLLKIGWYRRWQIRRIIRGSGLAPRMAELQDTIKEAATDREVT